MDGATAPRIIVEGEPRGLTEVELFRLIEIAHDARGSELGYMAVELLRRSLARRAVPRLADDRTWCNYDRGIRP